MSVAMTADAVIERRKTVTRRHGWWVDKRGRRLLQTGDRLTLCRKVQGRRAGEPLERLAEVTVVNIRREPLSDLLRANSDYGATEVTAEGFPGLDPVEFINRYFRDAQGIGVLDVVTRIEWAYLDPGRIEWASTQLREGAR